MEVEPDWGGTKLEHYLQLDFWEPKLACGVLSFHLFPEESCTVTEAMARMNRGQKEVNRLLQLWSSGGDSAHLEKHPPVFFIEWVLSQNIKPDWLDWAIERGLYIPKSGAGTDNIPPA